MEGPLEGDIQPPPPAAPPPSTAVVVWTPPAEPGLWQRMKWSIFGRPEPGLDGRFDHVIVDPSLISVPKDERLARQVLSLGTSGRLSVKNLYEALANSGAGNIRPKAVDAVRKDVRIAAERLEQRSPAAKLADEARARIEVLRGELDAIDSLRTDAQRLLQRTEGGVAPLLAFFDGQQVEVQTLLAGAANAAGGEQEKVELLRATLAGLVARRDAVLPSLEQQIDELRAKTAEVARADEARVGVITSLSAAERARYGERVQRAVKIGARFTAPGSNSAVQPQDVLAHLAWHGVDVTLGTPSPLMSLFFQRQGTNAPRQSVKNLTELEDMLKRLGIPR